MGYNYSGGTTLDWWRAASQLLRSLGGASGRAQRRNAAGKQAHS